MFLYILYVNIINYAIIANYILVLYLVYTYQLYVSYQYLTLFKELKTTRARVISIIYTYWFNV